MKAYMYSCSAELLHRVRVHFHQSSVCMHSSCQAHLCYCWESMSCVEHQISILAIWAVGCWSGMVEKMTARHNIELLGKTKWEWCVQQMIQNWPHILHCLMSLSYYALHLFIIYWYKIWRYIPCGMLYSVNLWMVKQSVWVMQSIGLKDCLTVTMKPVLSFDTSVTMYQSKCCNIPEAFNCK